MDLRGRIADACEEYDRDTDDITVVAVTKTHSAAAINTAVAAGIYEIGESKIQEAESKLNEVGPIARFHLVGHLQSNKVKKAVELFDVIQSIDSLKLAELISKEATAVGRTIDILVEVNCSGEEQKYGVPPGECIELLKEVNHLDNVILCGLMTVGPNTDDEEAIRAAFAQCRELFKQGSELFGYDFDTLSMGMSGDFELAIAEGSTMIRVGSILFGPRGA
jgi:hypothetical protein